MKEKDRENVFVGVERRKKFFGSCCLGTIVSELRSQFIEEKSRPRCVCVCACGSMIYSASIPPFHPTPLQSALYVQGRKSAYKDFLRGEKWFSGTKTVKNSGEKEKLRSESQCALKTEFSWKYWVGLAPTCPKKFDIRRTCRYQNSAYREGAKRCWYDACPCCLLKQLTAEEVAPKHERTTPIHQRSRVWRDKNKFRMKKTNFIVSW